jgi:ABC-type multidrug transport system ATPase subunit
VKYIQIQEQLEYLEMILRHLQAFSKLEKIIGYCPQFDAIFEGLTAKEHLEIYASFKGVRSDIRHKIAKKQI